MQKCECDFKFGKQDVFLKTQPDSGSIYKYEWLKL